MRNTILTALTVFSVAVAPTATIAEPAITVKTVEDHIVVEAIKSHIDTFELPTKEELAKKQIEENLKKLEAQKKAEEARKAQAEAARKAALKARVTRVVAIITNGSNADAIAYGQKRNAEVFGEQHWTSLYKLWSKESGWRDNAYNRSSGACGIPQFINGCVLGDHVSQIDKGLVYIARRYGNPTNAWNFWLRNHWY